MPVIVFLFHQQNFKIQCEEDDKMKDICEKFIQKYLLKAFNNIDFYDFKFICNEIEIEDNLIYTDLANLIDEESKIMYLLLKVYKLNNVPIKNEKFLEKFKDEDDIVILKYKIINNEKHTKKIFSELFVQNNIKNCLIIYYGKKYKLTQYLDLDENDYNKDVLEIKLLGISNIIDMSFMFEKCSALLEFSNKSKNIKNVINMEHLFSGCSYLRNLSGFSNWDTSNLTNMSSMFIGCTSLKKFPDFSKWNTSNVVKMNHLFSQCENLLSLPDISDWNVKNVIDMSFMFWKCSNLLTLPDISKWNTSNVNFMINMFSGCSSLTKLPDISKWNLTNVKNISSMFLNCKSLVKLPNISKWDTSNITNMSYMFDGCQSLIYVPDISRWRIDKLTNIRSIFNRCVSLLIKPKFDNFEFLNIGEKYIFSECINMMK